MSHHGHSHSGGGHGHSHGDGGAPHRRRAKGPEEGVFDGYDEIDEAYMGRVNKHNFEYDPQVKKALVTAQEKNDKLKRAKANRGGDHGHSHGGDQGPEPDSLEDMPVSEKFLEQYCYNGLLAHIILLQAQGADIKRVGNNASNASGATTLMWSALKGHLPIVKYCLDQGVDINACTSDGQTALMWAVTEGHLEIVKFLGENGADFTKKDIRGFDAYACAIQNDNFAMLLLLHQLKPMDPAYTDVDGHTYIHWCAYRNNLPALEFCHQIVGVDIKALDSLRRTGLHWACREGSTECIPYFLKNDVDPTQQDAESTTPIQHAISRNHTQAVKILRKRQTTPVSYVFGTLTLLKDKYALLLAIAPFIVLSIFFFGLLYLPPIAGIALSVAVTGKNMAVLKLMKRPVKVNVAEQTVREEMGAPKSFLGAARGTWYHRRRDPFMFSFWIAFILFEFFGYVYFQVPLPSFFLPTAIACCVLAFLTKRSSFRSIITPKSVTHSDLVKAVADYQLHLLNGRSMDIDHHVRLPLRAGYCIELDRYLKRYDSYSVLLDCPIAASNHHWFVMFVATLSSFQLATAAHGFWYLYSEFCSGLCPKAFPLLDSTGILASAASIVTGAIPCRDVMVSVDSLYGQYRPSPMNSAGPWIWVYPLCIGAATLSVVVRHLNRASLNMTRCEEIHPFAMSASGKPASIFKPGRRETIYGTGNPMANLFFFLIGRSYGSVDEYEMPAPAPGTKLVSMGGACGSGCGHSH